jgi:glycolate oxidase FAD binding subunit
VAAALSEASSEGRGVRPVGGGTKLSWGSAREAPEVEISTSGLDRVVEHNAGDLTAVLGAGVPLARAQEGFAEADQMFALDPPFGPDAAATLGGVLAAGDSGPLRARYGAARDLVIGVTVALSDGTIAKSGGKVIKNVAGYDLGKLFCGSFGTLGVLVEVALRLHPRPAATCTAVGTAVDPEAVASAAARLARTPLEHLALDLRWDRHGGAVLIRFGGVEARHAAETAERLLGDEGLAAEIVDDDSELWAVQREGQRSPEGTVLRLSALPSQLGDVLLEARRLGASLVGRAGLGLSWLRLEDRAPDEVIHAVESIRREHVCVVQDAPDQVRQELDVWGPVDEPVRALTRRLRERFDPAGVMNPGAVP